MPTSEVKGVWFTSARAHVGRVAGAAALATIEAHVRSEHREAVARPRILSWYPEEALAEALAALRVHVAHEDEVRFASLCEGCTTEGVGLGFRALLRVSGAAFVVKQVPTLWGQIRRGAGKVTSEVEAGRAFLRYGEFPWFVDDNYRIMTEASVRALVRVAARTEPLVTTVDHGRDSLTLEVRFFG